MEQAERSEKKQEKSQSIDAELAEYNALRGEIALYQTHQKQTIHFAILFGGAFITAMATIGSSALGNPKNTTQLMIIEDILVFAPIFHLLLSCIYTDKTVRVIRLASYIHDELRLRVIEKTGYNNLWNWEIYKSNFFEKKVLFLQKILLILLDKSRWAIFTLPIIFSLLFYVQAHNVLDTLTDTPISWVSIGFFCNVFCLLGTVVSMFAVEENKNTFSPSLGNFKFLPKKQSQT